MLVNGTTVRVVSNLNDGGPGSLRQALLDSKTSTGGNIIVFTVGGTIRIYSQLSIPSNVTIAGETAPGPMGITIYGDEAEVKNAHDVVVRYVRFRDYDRNRLKNDINTADTLEINGSDHVIVDHCSCAWGNDGTLDIWDSNHVTVQWTLISETLGPHSLATQIGGTDFTERYVTMHHNLWAHNNGRNPYVQQNYRADIVNNVIYNWGDRATTFDSVPEAVPPSYAETSGIKIGTAPSIPRKPTWTETT